MGVTSLRPIKIQWVDKASRSRTELGIDYTPLVRAPIGGLGLAVGSPKPMGLDTGKWASTNTLLYRTVTYGK